MKNIGCMSEKSKKQNSTEQSQKPFDYKEIENLRREAWENPQVKKNWEEFEKKQNNTN